MVLTRAQNQPGPDGILGDDRVRRPRRRDRRRHPERQQHRHPLGRPEPDLHLAPSHQVFLREYAANAANRPVSTGKLLGGCTPARPTWTRPTGATGIATWAAIKKQAASMLGLQLVDTDVTNIPMIAADPYGNFIPGPPRPAAVRAPRPASSRATSPAPVPVPANVLHFDTPFLTDIAHNADPSPQDTDHNPATPPVAPTPDRDDTPSADFANQPAGTYDDELLDAHFACGDGRCNENIALSTIHQVFHSEHDRLIDDIKNTLTTDTSADRRHGAGPVEARRPPSRPTAGTASASSRPPAS